MKELLIPLIPSFFISCTSHFPSFSMKTLLKNIKSFTTVKIYSTSFITLIQTMNYLVLKIICVSAN